MTQSFPVIEFITFYISKNLSTKEIIINILFQLYIVKFYNLQLVQSSVKEDYSTTFSTNNCYMNLIKDKFNYIIYN